MVLDARLPGALRTPDRRVHLAPAELLAAAAALGEGEPPAPADAG